MVFKAQVQGRRWFFKVLKKHSKGIPRYDQLVYKFNEIRIVSRIAQSSILMLFASVDLVDAN